MLKAAGLADERKRVGTWGKLHPDRLRMIERFAGRKILDAGCSSGDYVRHLIKKGYDARGLDLLAHEEWEGEFKGRFRTGDVNRLPYGDGEFDTVTAFEVLEHAPDIDTVLEEFKRVSVKNILLSVPDCDLRPVFRDAGLAFHHWIDRTHVQFFTEASLRAKLAEHRLVLDRLERINPVSPELIVLDSLGLPAVISRPLARALGKVPFKKKHFMTLLAAARQVRQ